MPRDYLNDPATTVRREDRAVNDETWIKQFLHSAGVGVVATVHDGQPFINQNLFVYDEEAHAIYTHTARKGRTRANVEEHEKVSFSIMEMGRLLPADEALEFSVEYAGVVVFGTAEMVEDEAESYRALQLLLDKYAPHLHAGQHYRPSTTEEIKRTSVFRIKIETWSAKKKEIEGFEGAFWYQAAPVLKSGRTRPLWQGNLQAIQIAPKAGEAVQTCDEVEVQAGLGILGDRYASKEGSWSDVEGNGREVTMIAQEDLDAIEAEYGIHFSQEETRRNLLTLGVPLSHLIGKRFWIGDVLLEGKRSCEPCNTMATRSGHGQAGLSAMLHRGGLRCEVIQGGTIRLGDSIRPELEIETLEN
jgi:nitroimidazol reductase NimA-like FMN-containing flavoprotein (pyridoxamine 5'-phosphate oxidase superfamily)/MOSC domain-containing protein YiiM